MLTIRGTIRKAPRNNTEGIAAYLARGGEIISSGAVDEKGNFKILAQKAAVAGAAGFQPEVFIGPATMGNHLDTVRCFSHIQLSQDELERAEETYIVTLHEKAMPDSPLGTYIFERITVTPTAVSPGPAKPEESTRPRRVLIQRSHHTVNMDVGRGVVSEAVRESAAHVTVAGRDYHHPEPGNRDRGRISGERRADSTKRLLVKQRPVLPENRSAPQAVFEEAMPAPNASPDAKQEYLKKLKRHNRFIIAAAIATVPAVGLTILYLCCTKISKRLSSKMQEVLPRFFARTLLRLNGVRVEVRGLEKIDQLKNKPFILFSAHKSTVDDYIYMAHLPFPHKSFRSDEDHVAAWKLRVFAWITKSLDIFFRHYKRDSVATAREFHRAEEHLLHGNALRLNPEGTRVDHEGLGKLGGGCGLLAIRTHAYVVPTVLINSRKAYEDNGWLFGPAQVTMILGDPISSDGYHESESMKFTGFIRERMQTLMVQR